MELLTLLSILNISLSSLPCHAATPASTAVRDTDGQALRADTEYYILPVIRGRGGGLTLASRSLPCPLFVAQETQEVRNGLPVEFTPASPPSKAVRLSTDLRVRFAAATTCVQSTEWHVGDAEQGTGRRLVVTGPVEDPRGASNLFKIEKHGDGANEYKMVFCPSACNTCRVACGDLGVFSEGGKRWLAVSDTALPVMFKKAASSRV